MALSSCFYVPKSESDLHKNNEQKVCSTIDINKFIASTHGNLPIQRYELANFGFPFVICLTPFPIGNTTKAKTISQFQDVNVCEKCKSLVNHKICFTENKENFICPICSHLNPHRISENQLRESMEYHCAAVEYDYPEFNNTIKKQRKYVFVIECSYVTVESGVYKRLIDGIYQRVMKEEEGLFSILVIGNGITYPYLSKRNNSLSVFNILDFDNSTIPPHQRTVFDIAVQRDSFESYYKALLDIEPQYVNSDLTCYIKCIGESYANENTSVVFFSSVANSYNFEDMNRTSGRLERTKCHFSIFLMQPDNNKRNFDSISEFCMLNNSHLRVYSLDQKDTMINDYLTDMDIFKVFNVEVTANFNPFFKLNDIVGAGETSGNMVFNSNCLQTGDSIYFYFDYTKEKMDISFPTFQFIVTYRDMYGKRKANTFTISFGLVDNLCVLFQKMNMNVHIAQAVHKTIKTGRKNNDEILMLNVANKMKDASINNNISKLFLASFKDNTMKILSSAYTNIIKTLNYPRAAEIFGRNPQEVSLYFAPLCYKLALDSSELGSMSVLNGNLALKDALYIRINPSKAVLLLPVSEDVQKWIQTAREFPLSGVFSKIDHPESIEIMTPKLSANNRLYMRLLRIMENSI